MQKIGKKNTRKTQNLIDSLKKRSSGTSPQLWDKPTTDQTNVI